MNTVWARSTPKYASPACTKGEATGLLVERTYEVSDVIGHPPRSYLPGLSDVEPESQASEMVGRVVPLKRMDEDVPERSEPS